MLTACSGQEGITNARYTIAAGTSFKVVLPCSPEVDTTSYQIHAAINLKCEDGTDTYSVRGVRYSNNLYHSDSVSNIDFDLDYSQQKFLYSNELNPLSAVPKSVKGYPGKEFRYEYISKDKIRFSRTYIVKNTLYELTFEGVKKDAYHNRIDAFFDSFEPTSIEDRSPPYLEVPSAEEIGELPFKVRFPGKTERKIQVYEGFFGKISLVLDMHKSDNPESEGYAYLMTSYGRLPDGMDEADRQRILTDQKELLKTGQVESKILEDFAITNGHEYVTEFSLAGQRVVDRRRVLIYGRDYVIINSLRLAEVPEGKAIKTFFASVDFRE